MDLLMFLFIFLVALELPVIFLRFIRGLIITWVSFILLAIGLAGIACILF